MDGERPPDVPTLHKAEPIVRNDRQNLVYLNWIELSILTQYVGSLTFE